MLQLRSLGHFVALSRRLNFARAAEDLGISQSALSRSIQALEEQLGMRLFDRDRSGVMLTPQGRLAVERAAVLLAEAEDFERQLVLSAEAAAGSIRFGMAPMPARALLPGVISGRLAAAPQVRNEVVVRDVEALWSLLVAGEIEFFVSNEGMAIESPLARIETIGQFPISLFVRAGHPLLDDPDSEATFPIVRSSWTGLPLPPEVERHMDGPAHVIEDFGALAGITLASDAIWFASAYAATQELRSGQLRELPRPEGARQREVRILVTSLERRSPSPWARALKQALRQQMKLLAKAG